MKRHVLVAVLLSAVACFADRRAGAATVLSDKDKVAQEQAAQQLRDLKYGLDQVTVIQGETKTFILTPADRPDLKQVEKWALINKHHRDNGARVAKTLSRIGDVQIIELPAATAEQTIQEYRNSGLFKAVENNFQYQARTIDPLSTYRTNQVPWTQGQIYSANAWQWYLGNDGNTNSVQVYSNGVANVLPRDTVNTNSHMHVSEAWAAYPTVRGSNQLICFIDTGFNFNHEDLTNSVYTNASGPVCFRSYRNTYVTNSLASLTNFGGWGGTSFHGSQVSGLASAINGNGKGIAGIASGAKVLYARIPEFNQSDVVACVDWALQYNPAVINCSWGALTTNSYSTALSNAMAAGQSQGVIFVCATDDGGFYGFNYDSPTYPGDYPIFYKYSKSNTNGLHNILAVASTMPDDKLFPGGSGYGSNWVDIGVPGRRIPLVGTLFTGHEYEFANGTSLSAGIMSGCVLLMRDQNPGIYFRTILNRIIASADKCPTTNDLINTATIAKGRFNLKTAMGLNVSSNNPSRPWIDSGGLWQTDGYIWTYWSLTPQAANWRCSTPSFLLTALGQTPREPNTW
jgi:hypothetical protein